MLLARGTASSPISVATTRSPASPAPSSDASDSSHSSSSGSSRSFHTPPDSFQRPRAILSPLAAPRSPQSPRSKPSSAHARPLHPFFLRRRAPPTPSRPRFVAHYTSSESSHGGRSPFGSASDSEIDDLIESMAALEPIRHAPPPSSRTTVAQGPSRRTLPRLVPKAKASVHTSTGGDVFTPSSSLTSPDPPPSKSNYAERRGLLLKQAAEEHKRWLARGTARREAETKRANLIKAERKERTDALHKSLARFQAKNAAPGSPPIQVSKVKSKATPPKEDDNLPPLPKFSHKKPLPGHFNSSPSIVYTRDPAEADDLIASLQGPLGFDMEWPIWVREWDKLTREHVFRQGRTAVLQFADERMVVVYHLRHSKADLGPGMRALLADKNRLKVGVNIKGDAQKLVRDGLIDAPGPAGLLELSVLAKEVDSHWGMARLVALARLARHYLGVELDKDEKVRKGQWDLVLERHQIEYAADDAFASLLIHKTLAAKLEEEKIKKLAVEGPGSAEVKSIGPVVPVKPDSPPSTILKAIEDSRVSPSAQAAFDLFISGADVPEVAKRLGLKESTVKYIAYASRLTRRIYIMRAGQAQPVIAPADAKRILEQVGGGSWASQQYYGFRRKLMALVPRDTKPRKQYDYKAYRDASARHRSLPPAPKPPAFPETSPDRRSRADSEPVAE